MRFPSRTVLNLTCNEMDVVMAKGRNPIVVKRTLLPKMWVATDRPLKSHRREEESIDRWWETIDWAEGSSPSRHLGREGAREKCKTPTANGRQDRGRPTPDWVPWWMSSGGSVRPRTCSCSYYTSHTIKKNSRTHNDSAKPLWKHLSGSFTD